MGDRYKPPRKQLPKRSLSPEPFGDSSTDDEANKGERTFPLKALISAWSYERTHNEENKVATEVLLRGPFMRSSVPEISTDEDDSAGSDLESSEELEVTPLNSSDAENDEDDSADSDSTSSESDSTSSDSDSITSSEELEVTSNNINDANNEPPNKKRRLHIIPPEAEVKQTDAKPSFSGVSEKANSD